MLLKTRLAVAFLSLTLAFGLQLSASAQESAKSDKAAKTLATGTFHGKVHQTSGRATIYQEADGKLVLRLTNFKTSNGPDVHVILVAVKDAEDDANFLKNNTERVELGKLKGMKATKTMRSRQAQTSLNSKRFRSIASALTQISGQRLWRSSNAGKLIARTESGSPN